MPKPKDPKRKAPRESRWESFFRQRGRAPELPDIQDGGHVVEYLQEMGWCQSVGMGAAPISWQEIDAWKSLTGAALTSWEALTVRQLSVVYCAQLSKSDDESCPPPWQSRDIDRNAVAQGMKSLTASINATKERGR